LASLRHGFSLPPHRIKRQHERAGLQNALGRRERFDTRGFRTSRAILREADGDSVAVVAKRHAVSQQTIYTSRKRFGSIEARIVCRLKALRELAAPRGRSSSLGYVTLAAFARLMAQRAASSNPTGRHGGVSGFRTPSRCPPSDGQPQKTRAAVSS
jgi:putative transposase